MTTLMSASWQFVRALLISHFNFFLEGAGKLACTNSGILLVYKRGVSGTQTQLIL